MQITSLAWSSLGRVIKDHFCFILLAAHVSLMNCYCWVITLKSTLKKNEYKILKTPSLYDQKQKMGASSPFLLWLLAWLLASLSHLHQCKCRLSTCPQNTICTLSKSSQRQERRGLCTAHPMANQLNLLLRDFSSFGFTWHSLLLPSSLQISLPSNIQSNSAWDHNLKL